MSEFFGYTCFSISNTETLEINHCQSLELLFILKAVKGALYLTSSLMATLESLLGKKIAGSTPIAITDFEETNIQDSNGELYFAAKLKDPITVRCSSDNKIPSFQTSEVLVRASALNLDSWELVDPKDPKSGLHIKGWVVDFSKGQKHPIYQETTIREWAKTERKSKNEQFDAEIKKMLSDKYGVKL